MKKEIITRDILRVKNYKKALRGYHVRKDILDSMLTALDRKYLKKQEIKIIDVGCGPGIVGLYFYKHLRKKNLKIKMYFVDINPLMLKQIPKNKDFKIMEMDITQLNLPSEEYDICLMKQVLDYLPKKLQIKALKNIYKILKKGGQFILSAIISPQDTLTSLRLTNYLYTFRERLLNPSSKIKKYIVRESTLIHWLRESGFKNIKKVYKYSVRLAANDFIKSFGIQKDRAEKLKELYREIVQKDKNNIFKAKRLPNGDYEFEDKCIVISCKK